MKYLIIIYILLSSVYSIQSQNSEKIVAWEEVEKTPVFEGCLQTESTKNCSEKAFINFVKNEFNHKIFSNSESDYTLNFRIIIGTDGKLRWSSVKASDDKLEKEAKRILSILPLYTPGYIDNKPVNVVTSYRMKLERQSEIANIHSVEIPPIPDNCRNEEDNKTCLSKSVSYHVNSNFDTNLARSIKNGLTIFRTTATFVIDKSGKIVSVTASGEHEIINQEAIRVVNTIPAMQPAISNGEPVAMSYSLPITIGFSR